MKPFTAVFVFSLIIFQFSFSQTPTPRASAQLIYFKPTQSLILVDGYEKGTAPASGKSETWVWKNGWIKIDSNDQPLRSLSAASYLPDRKSIFLYGGIGSRGYDDSLRDAYLFDGKSWKKLTGSFGTRDHHEMVYDEDIHSIVVYGGQTGNRQFDERTWIYKDEEWKALNIQGPGKRVHHAMAYDEQRKKVVLYGGFGDGSSNADTWEFDGNKWEKIVTIKNPGVRGHHAMVYDPLSKKVLLFGGDGEDIKGDLWSWDGKNWELISTNGPQRILPGMAFNSDNNNLYVFGGNGGNQGTLIYSDLWEWNGKNWRQVEKGETYEWDMQKDGFKKIK